MNKHLSSAQRYQIQIGLAGGLSVSAIAQQMGVHRCTLFREISRNAGGAGYDAKSAHQRAQARAANSRNARLISQASWQAVHHLLSLSLSPEQITSQVAISHEAIYLHLVKDRQAKGCWHLFLRCQKPYAKRCSGANRNRRGQIADRRPIEERPAFIELRQRVGDWEFDTICGPRHKSSLLCGVERKSGYIVLSLLKDKGTACACAAMIKLLAPFAHRVLTVTTDNGSEFALHKHLDAVIGCKSYFCRPYASCQRGSNENANGLLRQYLPKRRDLSTVTEQEIDAIMEQLNSRPRKRLGYKTPNDIFLKSIRRVAIRS